MQCNQCGQENPSGAVFCTRCNASLPAVGTLPQIGVGASYSSGWRMMWKHFWMLLLIGVILFAISMVASVFNLGIVPEPKGLITSAVIISILSVVYDILIVTPISVGVMFAYMKAARNETPEIEDMFMIFKDYWNVVLAMILTGLIVVVGLVLLIVPGIIFSCKLAFVPYLLIDKKMGATEAIKESWRMTKGHAWKVFWITLLAIPISIAGIICLGVGIIIATMWIYCAYGSLYHAVNSAEQASPAQGMTVAAQ